MYMQWLSSNSISTVFALFQRRGGGSAVAALRRAARPISSQREGRAHAGVASSSGQSARGDRALRTRHSALRTVSRAPRSRYACDSEPRLRDPSTMPQVSGRGAGVAAWLRRWWRALAAELLATALLVLLGVAALLPTAAGAQPPLAHPALAFGFIVLMNVEVFGPVSGAHMNPAVTLTALLDRRLGALPALGYLLAQLLGAVLGFALLTALAPAAFAHGPAGATAPAPGVSAPAAAAVEALLTGSLALLCCAVWAAHERDGPDRAVPVKFGLTVAGLVYSGGLLTGASLNPARSFAPALLQAAWRDHWVYWVGPLGGAALAALLHRGLRAPPPPRSPPPDVELPLHDKSSPAAP